MYGQKKTVKSENSRDPRGRNGCLQYAAEAALAEAQASSASPRLSAGSDG
ncbi:hypothetical protein [Paenibacillus lacisoli]|nr:hypothetical protein [Paenibacillus sp. JX-17]